MNTPADWAREYYYQQDRYGPLTRDDLEVAFKAGAERPKVRISVDSGQWDGVSPPDDEGWTLVEGTRKWGRV